MKKLTLSVLASFAFASGAASVSAAPVSLSLEEMDTVSGGAFVCPVIKTGAIENSAKMFVDLGDGYYSIVTAMDLNVPVHATNDDGNGSPAGPFAAPGDTTYTAIWNQ